MHRYLATLALLVALSGCKQESGEVSSPGTSAVTILPNGMHSVSGTGVLVATTPTSISVGIATTTPENNPPYALTPTIRFDGKHLQIKTKTNLPDGTLYRLGVQRNIAVEPSPTSTLTGMSTHAGGFMPQDEVDLPEDGLPLSIENFIPLAGRITGGEFITRVQMFPRHVQLFGTDDEPDRYTPNTQEVDVTFAVERDLPGQVKTLQWPEGTERFVWRHTVPCPLPEKTPEDAPDAE